MVVENDDIVREEIINGAQKLFKQFGLKKTTMDEIAAECGKAKSTLYHYFNSKEEVFDAVINFEMKSLRLFIKNKVEQASTLKDKIATYINTYHSEVINRMNLYRIVKYELLNSINTEKYFKVLMNYETAYLARIIEDGYDIEEVKGINKEDIPWFSEILIAGFFGIVRYSIENEEGIDQNKLTMAVNMLVPRLFR